MAYELTIRVENRMVAGNSYLSVGLDSDFEQRGEMESREGVETLKVPGVRMIPALKTSGVASQQVYADKDMEVILEMKMHEF